MKDFIQYFVTGNYMILPRLSRKSGDSCKVKRARGKNDLEVGLDRV
jgi:hypothetical protein